MNSTFSSPRNRNRTFILLAICAALAIVAVLLGIDDNPPGLLLAFLAALAFVLAFVHPWQTAREFMYLFLASVLGIVLFIILNIVSDSILQNPAASSTLKNLIESPVNNALIVIFAMLCPALFIVGAIGWIVMAVRSRQPK